MWLLSGREKRSKCARRRRGREDSECANRQPGTSAAAAEHLPDPHLPCLQLPVLCASLTETSLPARSVQKPSPTINLPTTLLFIFYFLIHPVELGYPQLRQARDSPSGPSLILSQFLEYFMENGDLRAVVRRFLPLRHPNCTHRMRLHADRRDPPLPPALHVSTSHRFGGGGGGTGVGW